MKYRIYFAQVNADYIEVEGKTEEIATKKAERIWKKENCPMISEIEKLNKHNL